MHVFVGKTSNWSQTTLHLIYTMLALN